MKASYTPLIWLALGGLGLSILSFVIWVAVNGGHQGFVVGMISERATSTITIVDRFSEVQRVTFTSETSVTRGRSSVSTAGLVPGTFVQVEGVRSVDGAIAADHIRFMSPPRPEPPSQPDVPRYEN